MSEKELLKEYHEKRDFERTAEPLGSSKKLGDKPIFVIQKHDARNLHYDFRIEVDGVLKSWAVPKGPSTNPKDKRMAVQTEDHPLEYADFEGVIPADQYGGGTVLVWDAGTYENLKTDDDDNEQISMEKALQDGHATIWLKGQKLRGGYAMIRTKRGNGKQWLLIKMNDKEAGARRNPVHTEPNSVLSGRSLEDIAAEHKGMKKK
jgi:DNA ligase D-like protein (predicted 3'-phosphoesterase)